MWADTPLSEIDRRRVVVYLDEVREASGPVAANRRHALLSKMWNFGLQRDLVSTNPVVGISKNRETPKDRFLAEDELRKLLSALDGDPAHQVAKMILFTGMRPGEVIGMRWTDLEGDDWYNLPAEDAKNGIALRVYLSEPARDILRARRSLQQDLTAPHVFLAPNGKPLASVRKPLLEVRKSTGVDFTPQRRELLIANRALERRPGHAGQLDHLSPWQVAWKAGYGARRSAYRLGLHWSSSRLTSQRPER